MRKIFLNLNQKWTHWDFVHFLFGLIVIYIVVFISFGALNRNFFHVNYYYQTPLNFIIAYCFWVGGGTILTYKLIKARNGLAQDKIVYPILFLLLWTFINPVPSIILLWWLLVSYQLK